MYVESKSFTNSTPMLVWLHTKNVAWVFGSANNGATS